MDRPTLQHLLARIRERRIDVFVVYKVDRLTRSLADFAKRVEVFDADAVSFVSITQAFNSTTSKGRLTLNVLLSFARFGREVSGERNCDKITASKKKGLWMGGQPALGHDVKDTKAVVNEMKAETVRTIFRIPGPRHPLPIFAPRERNEWTSCPSSQSRTGGRQRLRAAPRFFKRSAISRPIRKSGVFSSGTGVRPQGPTPKGENFS